MDFLYLTHTHFTSFISLIRTSLPLSHSYALHFLYLTDRVMRRPRKSAQHALSPSLTAPLRRAFSPLSLHSQEGGTDLGRANHDGAGEHDGDGRGRGAARRRRHAAQPARSLSEGGRRRGGGRAGATGTEQIGCPSTGAGGTAYMLRPYWTVGCAARQQQTEQDARAP
jgi:hypothetical protein